MEKILHDMAWEKLENGKFEIVNIKRFTIGGKTNFYGQIQAIRDIDNKVCVVKQGKLGGWILLDGKRKLDEEDESWIDNGSIVGKGCFISGNETYVSNSILVGVRAYGACIIEKSHIFSKDTAFHGDIGIYGTTISKCDVHIEGSSDMNDCAVSGKYLSMKGENFLDDCVVHSIGEGISLVGGTELSGKVIKGQGSIFGNRVTITSRSREGKGD